MSSAAIRIKQVSKSFGDAKVLVDISVEFEQGKIHGLIGRNGSGKTVLLKCICGLLPYDFGSIVVNEKVIGRDVEMPGSCGAMIETPGFLPQYSAYSNLKFLASLSRRASKEDVREAIALVGLDPSSAKHVKKFSLGMRQRLAIAQAIMEKPRLFILDEPLSGLDKKGLAEIRSLFLDYKSQGKTMVIASHSSEDIDILCDSVHELDQGSLIKIR